MKNTILLLCLTMSTTMAWQWPWEKTTRRKLDSFYGNDCITAQVFDGHCEGDEIRVYEGNGDNWPSASDQITRCADACRARAPPSANVLAAVAAGGAAQDWSAYTGQTVHGFVITSSGRCYCEFQDSTSCTRSLNTNYDRYDIKCADGSCSDYYQYYECSCNAGFAGTSSCPACDAGEYAAAGAASCTDCAAGKYDHDSDPSTVCEDCPSGKTSSAGATSCASNPLVNNPLVNKGVTGCTTSNKCGKCEGDCDSDNDCAAGLKCYQRASSDEIVPGCEAGGSGDVADYDYCYEPQVEYDDTCSANEYVSNHVCTACPILTSNGAGDDASGDDTTCISVIENCVSAKIFDGECGGSEIRMFEGEGTDDNPGSFEEKKARCAHYCNTKATPSAHVQNSATASNQVWSNYVGLTVHGFIVESSGRCYCEFQDSSSCDDISNGYHRFDFKCAGGTCTNSANSYTCSCNAGFIGTSSCSACSSGEYAAAGAASCTDCAAGTYSGAAYTDCVSCTAGWVDHDSDPSTPCTRCPAGTKKTDQTTCTACQVGQYAGNASSSCNNCEAGTYDDDSDPATVCTNCAAGTTSTAGQTSCGTTCATGKYAAAGAASCTNCAAGKYDDDSDASTACENCANGKSSTAGQTSCTNCVAGKYSSSVSGHLCDQCDAGYISAAGVTSCTNCVAGKKEVNHIQCDDCDAGQYSGAASVSCTDCVAGTVDGDSNPATVCTNCAMGKITSSAKQTSCANITAGKKCKALLSGNTITAESTGCKEEEACGAGDYSLAGNNECEQIPGGKKCSTTSATECPAVVDCGAGQFSLAGNNAACQVMPSGHECSDTNQLNACPGKAECGAGEFSAGGVDANGGAIVCADIPAGEKCQLSTTPTTCAAHVDCGAGFYSAIKSNTCTEIPAGHMCTTNSATECPDVKAVGAGYYSVKGNNGRQAIAAGTECTSTSPTECPSVQNCPSGKWSPGGVDNSGDNNVCVDIPAGKKCGDVDGSGDAVTSTCTQIVDCGVGEYSAVGAADCQVIGGGYECSSDTQGTQGTPTASTVNCQSIIGCEAGESSASGVNLCSSCAADNKYSQALAASCSTCPAGSYTSGGDSNTRTHCTTCPHSHKCGGTSVQTACKDGEYQDQTGQSSCKTCSNVFAYLSSANDQAKKFCDYCTAGYGVTQTVTSSAHVQCEVCDIDSSGSEDHEWNNGATDSSAACAAVSTCPAGSEYIVNGGTSPNYANDECRTCPAGKYNDADDFGACVVCPVGTYLKDVIAPFQINDLNRNNADIIAAKGRHDQLSDCLACPVGKYLDSTDNDQPEDCKLCPMGTYNTLTGQDAVSDCLACPVGKYLDSTGNDALSDCINCPVGTYMDATGSDDESDCKICGAGKYLDTVGNDAVSDCKNCPAGSHLDDVPTQPGTAAGRAEHDELDDCMVCNKGQYSAVVASSSISDCTACPAGSYLEDDPDSCLVPPCQNDPTLSVHHDSINDCSVCEEGKYSTVVGSFDSLDCTDCVAGKHLEHVPNPINDASESDHHDDPSDCTDCVAGKYSFVAGSFNSMNCTDCPVGTYSNVPAQDERTDCVDCTAGSGQPLSQAASTGTYQDLPGQTSCKPILSTDYCTATNPSSPLQKRTENAGTACSAVATKQCICSANGIHGSVGADCHEHGAWKCIAPCDNAHYLYQPRHYDQALDAYHEHRCVVRGSLPNTVTDVEIDNFYGQAASVKVSSTSGRFTNPSTMSFSSGSVEFDDARRDLSGANKVANVLGARAVSNVITTALDPGEGVLVAATHLGTPVKDYLSAQNIKRWKPNTMLIRPTPKKINGNDKLDSELTCAEDADVDLWPVPDYNYKVFLKYVNDRSLKCWNGQPQTLLTLTSKAETGLNTYVAKCYKNGGWVTATKNCVDLLDSLPSTLNEGACFLCDFGSKINPHEHRNYVMSDTGAVDSGTNCIAEGEKVMLASGKSIRADKISVGMQLKTSIGITTVRRVKSQMVQHRQLFNVQCDGNTATLTGGHAYICDGKWHHASKGMRQERRLSESDTTPKRVLSIQTTDYCQDNLVLSSGLVVESWDGREEHQSRSHHFANGRRLGCMR